jgi:hypothetical protein
VQKLIIFPEYVNKSMDKVLVAVFNPRGEETVNDSLIGC